MQIFNNIINVFTVTLDTSNVSLLNQIINFFFKKQTKHLSCWCCYFSVLNNIIPAWLYTWNHGNLMNSCTHWRVLHEYPWTAGILRDCDVPETLRDWHESSSTSANAQTQGPAITISCSECPIMSSNTGSSLSRAHSGSQVPPLIPIVHRPHRKNGLTSWRSLSSVNAHIYSYCLKTTFKAIEMV